VRWLAQHRTQLLLSVVGVSLGVAVVLSIDLAIQSSRAAFRVSAETVSGRATHQVSSSTGSLHEELLTEIRIGAGIRAAAPVVEGFATSPLLPGQALRVLGVDPFSEEPFRPFVAGGGQGFEVGAFLTIPLGVVLARETAVRAGVGPGDSLSVLAGGVFRNLPVVGLVDPAERLAQVGLSDVLLMDVAGAQDLLRTHGALTRIDLRIADDPSGVEELERLAETLPPDVTVRTVGARADALSGMIAAFDVNLTALSLLALIFGMFLIYNAATFSVVQRRGLFGRLRTLGVTRGEILRSVLAEAAAIGVAGAAVGLVLGVVLARGLVRLVTRTINDLYFTVSVEGLTLEPILVAKAAGLGIGATLLAALPPALEAAASEPRLASLRSVAESGARRAAPRAAAVGLGMAALGAGVILVSGRSLPLSFGALFLIVAGAALTTPASTIAFVALTRPMLRRTGGTLGVMASRGVVSALTRTAPAIAALVVAVSVTVGLGVMIQSFRGTLTQWLDVTLRADVYVSLPGPTASRASGTLWPELVEDFIGHPAVVGHSTYRGIDVVEADGTFRLVAMDLDPRGEGAFAFLDGDREEVMRGFQAGDGVIVSEPYAFRRRVGVGDTVELSTPSGPAPFPILGVFYDYGSDQGALMMSRRLYDGFFDDSGVTSLGLFLAPGRDSEAVVRDLLRLVPEGRSVIARTNDTLRSASLVVFDRTFEVTAVLRLLAFGVAFVGVLSALMAVELERARELAVLRATGLTPGQVWKLVVTQTGLMGLISGLLALPLGLALSVVMVFVINKRSFGWTLDMQVGPDVLLQAVGLALVGALLAGLYPAWRMSRASPAAALRGE
jgi:putative ABC transport system permease protein